MSPRRRRRRELAIGKRYFYVLLREQRLAALRELDPSRASGTGRALYRQVDHTSDVCCRLTGTTAPRLRFRLVARVLRSYTTRVMQPRRTTLTRWARDPRPQPVKATTENPQTPVSVIEHSRSARAVTIEISGRKPLSLRAPFRSENSTAACQGGIGELFRASTARFVEPCDPPYVSAPDASDSVTASRQLSTSTHASVRSRRRRKTCASRSVEESGVSRRPGFASVSLRFLVLFRCVSSVFFSKPRRKPNL